MSAAATQWKCNLDFYPHLKALCFADSGEFAEACKMMWEEPMREMPHDLVGDNTVIVPAEAELHFMAAGLKFQSSNVRSPGDLPTGKITKLRREQGLH